jgi:hypothetical protein
MARPVGADGQPAAKSLPLRQRLAQARAMQLTTITPAATRPVTATVVDTAPAPTPTARQLAVAHGFDVTHMVDQVTALGGPRVSGTADLQRATELVRGAAAANGWSVHVEHVAPSWQTRGRDLYNVVADHPGTGEADGSHPLVIAGAHLDTVIGAYGANDDASGSAALLEATRVFSALPTKDDLRFVWFDGEELGTLGSSAYVRAHAEEVAHAKVMVMAEMLAAPEGSPNLVFTSRAGAAAAPPVVAAATAVGITPHIEVDRNANSDHQPFVDAGIPAFVVSSALPRTMSHDDPNYHRPTDTVDHMNREVYATSAQLLGLAIDAYASPA